MHNHALKVRHPPIVAPVAITAPPQRLVLRPADLTRLGIRLALELGWRAAAHVLVEGLAVVGAHLDLARCCRRRRLGRLGGRGRAHFETGGDGRCALEAFELGLLGGGEAGGRWGGFEGRGGGGGGRGVGSCEGGAEGAEGYWQAGEEA